MKRTSTIEARPTPLLLDSDLYADYFAGLRDGIIHVPSCVNCGTLQWPPREMCGTCHATSFERQEVPAEGSVYTYSVMYRAFHPWFRDKLPYGVAVVDVAPGVRILGRYADTDIADLECGTCVTAVFDDLGSGSDSIAWRRRS